MGINILLEAKADIYKNIKETATLMHFTASNNLTQTLELLIKYKGSPHVKDSVGNTPLHMATFHGHSSVIKLLINHGASPYAKDKDGITPIHVAAIKGQIDALNLFDQNQTKDTMQSKDGTTPLHAACISNQPNTAIALIKKYPNMINLKDSQHHTALYYAIANCPCAVEPLIIAGADLGYKSKHQDAPLVLATKMGKIEIANMIAKHLKEQLANKTLNINH